VDSEQGDLALTPDESLLWSGRADPVRLLLPRVQFLVFGLLSAFLGVAVVWMYASDPAPASDRALVTAVLVAGGFCVGAAVCLTHFGRFVRVALSTSYYVTTRRLVCCPRGGTWGDRSEIPVADLNEWKIQLSGGSRRSTITLRRSRPYGDPEDPPVKLIVGVERGVELQEVLEALRHGLIPPHARL
jgi:hypothetical protein